MEKCTSSGQRFPTAQFLLKYFQGLHKPLGKECIIQTLTDN